MVALLLWALEGFPVVISGRPSASTTLPPTATRIPATVPTWGVSVMGCDRDGVCRM
jgi:hypothetical protein